MAYTGINKAQFEEQKFNIEADARRNTASIIANTTLSVGQTLVQNSMQDKLEELNNQAEIDLSDREAEIYANTDPEQWEESINSLYAEYGESVTSQSKMWATVKKQFKKGLETRKAKRISAWNAQKTQDDVAATQAHNTNQLNAIVQSQDVTKLLQSSGIIMEKGYTGKPVESEPTLADGFVSAGDSRIGGNEPAEEGESMVFSGALQEAYNNGASRFDLSVMAIEHYAKKLHPFSEKMQQDTINKYTEALRDTMPNNDLVTVFNATFSDKNVNDWDFSTFMKEYKAGLENESYGGELLSETKKNELIAQAGKMWDSLVAQKTREAADFYENNIKNPMQELKTAQATNSNNLYYTEDVNAVYDKALKDNPVHAKFLMAQKEADLTIARNNERIQMQRQFKNLYTLGGERTDSQEQKLVDISANFSQEELISLKQQSLSEANVIQGLKDFEKSPNSFQTTADIFDKALAKVRTGGYKTKKEMDSAIDSLDLPDDQKQSLKTEGNRYFARQDEYMSENIAEANNELGVMSYRGSLSQSGIEKVAEKYGLSVEENPEFFSSWKNQAEAQAQDNALKMFNSLNYDDSMTTTQAKSILDTYGITKEDPLYKQMMDTAEANWQKHLGLEASKAQGFSGKEHSDGDALKSVRAKIGEFSNGNIAKSDMIDHLISQKSNLTETDYKTLYNEINNEHLIKKAQSDATFEDKVFRPYLSEQDTIMPGMTDKRMKEAGLDPLDFADDATYLQMKDAEVINQHIAYVDQYTDNQMYLSLKERGLSDESIRELGFSIPDTSFQNTLQWAREHKGEKPVSRTEYAQELLGEAKGKMISGNLPSGRSYGGSSTTSSLDETIAKSADRIYDNLLEASKIGGNYDNPDAIKELNLRKYEMEDIEYDRLAYAKLMNGEITEKTYLAAINEDVSAYKSPEYKQVQDAMKVFMGYVEEASGFGMDKDGKKVPASSYLTDSVVANAKAAFLDEYQYALANANGAFVDPDAVAERVYNSFLDAKYTEYADKTMDILQSDTTVFYTNVFGRENANKAAYTDFSSGQLNMFDQKIVAGLMSDPSNSDAGFGTNSSQFGMWLTMQRNGSSEEEIGNTIAHDVAKALNIDVPPVDSDGFEKKFEEAIQNLPPMARAQWEQASLVAKWTLDVYELAKSKIDPEIIKQLDPKGNMVPFVENNQMGVEIGGQRFYYDDGGEKASRGFVYAKEGSAKSLYSESSAIAKSKTTLEEAMTDTFVLDQYGQADKYARYNLFSGDEVNVDAVEGYLNRIIQRKQGLLEKKGQAYISSLNAKAEDLESLTGNAGTYYSGIEYKVDTNALNKAKEDGTIQTKPLSNFITYTLVPAIHR